MKNAVLLLVALLGFQEIFGQISFQKQYGAGTMDEHGRSVVQAADSSYYVSGVRVSGSLPNIIGEAMLVHTDKYGNEVWTKYYSVPGSDSFNFYHIENTSDNKLIVTGVADYGYENDYDNVFLSKIDMSGNVLWYKNYSRLYAQKGMQVKETFDGGYIIGGWNRPNGSTSSMSFHLIRTDNVGDTIWTRTYPGSYQRGFAVEQTQDLGFVIAGSIDQVGQIGTDILIMKTNSFGDLVWTKTIDFPGSGEAKGIEISNNGNIIISGWTTSTGCQAYILMELDQNGNISWLKNYNIGYCAWNHSLCKTTDDGYVIFGMSTNYDYYLVKTDSAGNQQWFKTFGENLEYGYDVRQTFDGGYIMTGDTYISNDLNVDMLLVKTDSMGNVLDTNNITNIPHESFVVYPNPADDLLHIQTDKNTAIVSGCVFNNLGRKVKFFSGTKTIDVSGLNAGIYFLKLKTTAGEVYKKIVVE